MATTNNIGLYCFDTGNEDAKTSLEALFGAGNSNMKKIDDAIGDLKKKSFIVNTEAELNALLTEENLGKTVSFNGALYIITEGGASSVPFAVGDTLDKIYFDTSVENLNLSGLSYNDGLSALIVGGDGFSGLWAYDVGALDGESSHAGIYCLSYRYDFGNDDTGEYIFYANTDFTDADIGEGWNTEYIVDGVLTLPATLTIASVNQQQDLWSAFISKEPFGASTGGGIIAKPVGAEGGGGLPSFAPEDAGKFLRVDSNGNIVAEAIAYAEGESF